LRVTTTEAKDIFDDDEIWNNSCYTPAADLSDPTISAGHPEAADLEKSVSQIRANPEEEYFRLLCLALKIEHSLKGDDNTVFTISEGKLYRMIKKRQVPFHVWHRWIDG